MTIQEAEEIYAEAEQHCPPITSIDHLETIYTEPPLLGSGYEREIELCLGLKLCIVNILSRDVTLRFSENNHPVQFSAFLSGALDSGSHLQITPQQGYIGGMRLRTASAV